MKCCFIGDDELKMLYLESWNNLKGRNMHKFWRSTLDLENKQLLDLLQLDLGKTFFFLFC